jgi:hypothetical protein
MTLPTDAAARKAIPVYSGFIKYFPRGMIAVAQLSKIGNEQHNPGQPLYWDRSKSGDEMDALVSGWTSEHDAAEVVAVMLAAEVPVAKVYTIVHQPTPQTVPCYANFVSLLTYLVDLYSKLVKKRIFVFYY